MAVGNLIAEVVIVSIISVHRLDLYEPDMYKAGFQVADVDSINMLARWICYKTWSPIIWKNGYRDQYGFEEAHFLVLDIDDGMTLNQAMRWMNETGLWHVIGTTKSHRVDKYTETGVLKPACDRFRLIIKAGYPVRSREDYIYNMQLAMDQAPGDTACKDTARLFYKCSKIVQMKEGKCLSWKPKPQPTPEEIARYEQYQIERNERLQYMREKENLMIPINVMNILAWGSFEGSRHNWIYKIGCELTRAGFTASEIIDLILNSTLGINYIATDGEEGRADVYRTVRDAARKVGGPKRGHRGER